MDITAENMVGRKVRALEVGGFARCQGQVITVNEIVKGGPGGMWTAGTSVKGTFVNPDDENTTLDLWATKWEFVEDVVAGVTVPADATREEILAIIERLANDKTEAMTKAETREKLRQDSENRVRAMQDNYRHDMQHWEETLRNCKEEQDWCDDGTNTVIEILNRGFIGGYEVEPYVQYEESEVEIEGTLSTTITVRHPVGDDATDPENWVDDDGDSIDGDEFMREALRDAVRHSGFDDVSVL